MFKHTLSGSEAAAAIGVDKHCSPLELFLRKTGRMERPPVGEEAKWGQILEPKVANHYAERTGYKIRRCPPHDKRPIRYVEDPWAIGHPDYRVYAPAPPPACQPQRALLEVKTTGLRMAGEWEDEEGPLIPLRVEVQCRWYLLLTGLAWCDIAVLIGGQEYRQYRIDHDEFLEDLIFDRAREFMQYLEADQPPPYQANAVKPEVMAALHPQRDQDIVVATPEQLEIIEALRAKRAELKAVESAYEGLVSRVKDAIGGHAGLSASDGAVTWKQTKDVQTVDWERAFHALVRHVGHKPELAALLVFDATHTRPGPRRFVVPRAWDKE